MIRSIVNIGVRGREQASVSLGDCGPTERAIEQKRQSGSNRAKVIRIPKERPSNIVVSTEGRNDRI